MPALHLFGRRTLVGGDDVQIPALLTILMRFVQIVLFITPIGIHMCIDMIKVGLHTYLFWDACGEGEHWFPLLLAEYMLASLLYSVLSILLEWRIVMASFQGTPTQPQKRQETVRFLLQLRLVAFFLLNAAVLALGVAAVCFTKRYYDCQRYLEGEEEAGSSDDAAAAEGDDYYAEAAAYQSAQDDPAQDNDDTTGNDDNDDGNERLGMLKWLRRVTVWWVCLTLLLLSHLSEVMWSLASLVALLRKERVSQRKRARASNGEEGDDDDDEGFEQAPRHAVTEEMWNDRCRLIWKYLSMATCFLFGGKELVETSPTSSTTGGPSGADYYGDIARALADYFEDGGVLDLVASDVAAGILMLQRVQRQRLLEAREGLLKEKENSFRQFFVTGPCLTDDEGDPSHHGLSGSSFDSLDSENGGAAAMARTHSPALSLAPSLSGSRPATPTPMDCGAFADSLLPSPPPPSMQRETAAVSSHLFVATQDFSNASASGGVEVINSENMPTPKMTGKRTTAAHMSHPYNTAMALTMRHRHGRTSAATGGEGGGEGREGDKDKESEEKRRAMRLMPQPPPLLQQQDDNDANHSIDDFRRFSSSMSRVSSCSFFYQPERRKVLVPTDAYDRAVLEEGARFARHALAIYTWVLYVYMQPLKAPLHLLFSSGVGGPRAAVRIVLQALCGCITNDDSKKDEDGHSDEKNDPERPLSPTHNNTTAGAGATDTTTTVGRRKKKWGSGTPLQGPVPDERLSLNYDSTATTPQALGATPDSPISSPSNTNSTVPNSPPTTTSRSSSPEVGGGGVSSGCAVTAGCTNLVGALEGIDHPIIIGDNACQAHKTALLAHAGLEESDLIYVQLENGLQETPYCIVLDHKWRSVVLALRGSLSIEDCLVDVLINPISLEDVGRAYGFDGDGQYCHGGVVSRVRWIAQDLQRHGRLDHVLTKYPHYTLRIVGHSLGAGCGVVLSWMLRSKYPTLRCLSYSPPGGLLSWELATHCQDFCTSFVLDKEWVPRASLETMEHLRNEVLELIGRIKVPKARVAQTLVSQLSHKLWKCLLGRKNRRREVKGEDTARVLAESNAQLLYAKTETPADTVFGQQLVDFKRIQTERKRLRGHLRNVKLYPPGRIVHLVKTGEGNVGEWTGAAAKCITCGMTNWGDEYTPVWAEREDFNEIVISPTMATDHFPNRVCLEMERVARSFAVDTTLGSSAEDRQGGAYQEPTLLSLDNAGSDHGLRLSTHGALLVPANGTF